jgi:tRNA pseudouridine32 synthase / 23S rRNA pseudouridine746 synthase
MKINLPKLPILYEDDGLIVINKPAGLLTVPDGYDSLLPHIRSVLEPTYGRLWIAHRLDKDTSGAIILTKNSDVHRQINELFRLRKVTKIYHGLVTPVPAWKTLDIQNNLETNADRMHRTRVKSSSGKPARSLCKVLKIFNFGALLEIELFTGITHQIRAHLRTQNLALFGDKLYNAGLDEQPLFAARTMLHARSVSFSHPTTHDKIHITAPYPDDFRGFYNQLRATKALDAGI